LIQARDTLPNKSIIAKTGMTEVMPMIGVRKTAGNSPPATPVMPVMPAVTKAIRQTRRISISSKSNTPWVKDSGGNAGGAVHIHQQERIKRRLSRAPQLSMDFDHCGICI
jgi:hypothetical protein